jgi:hypothetical protein
MIADGRRRAEGTHDQDGTFRAVRTLGQMGRHYYHLAAAAATAAAAAIMDMRRSSQSGEGRQSKRTKLNTWRNNRRSTITMRYGASFNLVPRPSAERRTRRYRSSFFVNCSGDAIYTRGGGGLDQYPHSLGAALPPSTSTTHLRVHSYVTTRRVAPTETGIGSYADVK